MGLYLNTSSALAVLLCFILDTILISTLQSAEVCLAEIEKGEVSNYQRYFHSPDLEMFSLPQKLFKIMEITVFEKKSSV